MGMYDEVRAEYPLPDPEAQDLVYQTKSLDCFLDDFTVTRDGRLILHAVDYEQVPENERPNYGKPEWEHGGIGQLMGSLHKVPLGDVEIPYDGDLEIHTSTGSHEKGDYRWYEYIIRFEDGRVSWIKRAKEVEEETEARARGRRTLRGHLIAALASKDTPAPRSWEENDMVRKVTVEEARARLPELMGEVNRDGSAVIIDDQEGGEVAMIPAAELASLLEVDHLTQSPENARRLFRALANAMRGNGQ